jgi:hypothetical protein
MTRGQFQNLRSVCSQSLERHSSIITLCETHEIHTRDWRRRESRTASETLGAVQSATCKGSRVFAAAGCARFILLKRPAMSCKSFQNE